MTNFQYLSRAWDLQWRDGKKLTDFAGWLKNTIREVAVHIKNKYKKDKVDLIVDMVFSIMGAMLMSEKDKDWNPNIYPHLIKTMDSHYTMIAIACEAQQYVDWGVKMDSTTSHDTAYYACRPQQSSRINRRTEPKQPPRSNNRPMHSQQSSSSKHSRDYHQMHKMHNRNTEPTMCRNYTRGIVALTDATAHIITHLLHRLMSQQRMKVHHPQTSRNRIFSTNKTKMWWLVFCSSTQAITYSTFRNSPCINHHSLRLP